MKKILTLAITIFLLTNIFSQKIIGKWKINSLIDNKYPPEEYILYQTPDKYGNEFGPILVLKSDSTFISYQIPGCGQDRFPPSTYGKYTIIDDNYISFFLEKRNEEKETLINEDLGKFYYVKKDDGFRFLKSCGNIELDKQTIFFRELLFDKNNEINKYEDDLLNWNLTQIKTVKEAVNFYLDEKQIKDFEILYITNVEGYNRTIILGKVRSDFKYILFERDFYGEGRNRIALYDDSKVKEIDKLVTEINNYKNMKIKEIIKNEANQNLINNPVITIELFQKNEKTKKVIYNKYTSYSNQASINNITVYFHEEEPIYVEYVTKHINNEKKQESITDFYILDYKSHKYITKPIKKENGKNDYPYGLIIEAINEINLPLN